MKKVLIFIVILGVGFLVFTKIKTKKEIFQNQNENQNTSDNTKEGLKENAQIFDGEEGTSLKTEDDFFIVNMTFPAFDNLNISKSIKDYISTTVADFKAENNFNDLSPEEKDRLKQMGRKYTISSTYKTYKTSKISSVIFSIATDTGGAHGNLIIKTLNFDTTGHLIEIGSLFKPESNYLTRLSDLSRPKLKENLKDAIGEWYLDGTTPSTDNFASFYLKDDSTLVIIFQPYQVAPWVAGTPEVSFSITNELSDIINEEFK